MDSWKHGVSFLQISPGDVLTGIPLGPSPWLSKIFNVFIFLTT